MKEESTERGKGKEFESSDGSERDVTTTEAPIHPDKYVRLGWDGHRLSVVPGGDPQCGSLDLSGTHSLPEGALKDLSRLWTQVKFNLTDDSVLEWLRQKPHMSSLKHVVLHLPGPRGFESPDHQRTTNNNNNNSKKRRKRKNGARRRKRDGPDRGIEGFLRRQTERFSFQTSLTRWTETAERYLKETRPGPVWWPAKVSVKFSEHADRFLDAMRVMSSLEKVSVVMFPCSMMGYKDLDQLMGDISDVSPQTALSIHYVDDCGTEDAHLIIPDCDYEISNSLAHTYESFEAIRRVDSVSLTVYEWGKWLIYLVVNVILWFGILRILLWLLLG